MPELQRTQQHATKKQSIVNVIALWSSCTSCASNLTLFTASTGSCLQPSKEQRNECASPMISTCTSNPQKRVSTELEAKPVNISPASQQSTLNIQLYPRSSTSSIGQLKSFRNALNVCGWPITCPITIFGTTQISETPASHTLAQSQTNTC